MRRSVKQGETLEQCRRARFRVEVRASNAQQPALGVRLQLAREFSDARGLLSTMIVILVIGILVDAVLFGRLDAAIRRRWGLTEAGV